MTMVIEKCVDINPFDSVVTHIRSLTFRYVHHPGFNQVLIIDEFVYTDYYILK